MGCTCSLDVGEETNTNVRRNSLDGNPVYEVGTSKMKIKWIWGLQIKEVRSM
jgi:hypothetical protein